MVSKVLNIVVSCSRAMVVAYEEGYIFLHGLIFYVVFLAARRVGWGEVRGRNLLSFGYIIECIEIMMYIM